jgi:branched-chain amino acid transport system substrate-binding protein
MLKIALKLAALMAATMAALSAAHAQGTIKIGLVQSMSGPLAAIGKQVLAGARLYMQIHGDTIAGRKIELILRDDTTAPETARRHAQDLIVNSKVDILGVGITPAALAIAPLATEAKIPTVVMVSGTAIVVERSPMFVRVSFTLGQQASIIAQWAAANGIRKVAIVQSDWAPGAEAAAVFSEYFTNAGGQVTETLKVPLASPDFAPFLQRVADGKPDGLFVFVPTGQAGIFARQFIERGLHTSGIKLIGTGDITDDDDLPGMGDPMLGVVTAGIYSASHDSAVNKAYVDGIRKANNGLRPNFISLGGYDGMHAIYEALKKTGGKTDGPALIEAMRGLTWESPRGQITIDAETREIVQNVYLRRVERVGGELYNTEFETIKAVKAPRVKQ